MLSTVAIFDLDCSKMFFYEKMAVIMVVHYMQQFFNDEYLLINDNDHPILQCFAINKFTIVISKK